MPKSADGKRTGNRMQMKRYDKAHAEPEKKSETEPKEEHEEPEMKPMGEEQAEEQPGMHEEIKGIVAQHGPAHQIHMAHDHQNMKSEVHSMHESGHQHRAMQEGEKHKEMAHEHAKIAAGMPPDEEKEEQGEYPEEHQSETPSDDYNPEPL